MIQSLDIMNYKRILVRIYRFRISETNTNLNQTNTKGVSKDWVERRAHFIAYIVSITIDGV